MKKILSVLLLALSLFIPQVQAEPWRVKYSADPLSQPLNDISIPSLDVIYVVGGGASGQGVILKSTDRGETWTEKYRNDAHGIYAIDCQTSLICYAAGEGGRIYKTTNGGETPADWSVAEVRDTRPFIMGPDPRPLFYDIKVVNATTVVAVGNYGAVFRTTTSGVIWNVLDAPNISANFDILLSSVHFSGNTGYIVGDSRTVLKSVDGGASWSSVALPAAVIGNCGDIFTLDGEKLWAGCATVGKSEDGGASFISSATIYGWPQNSVAFVDSSNGWAVASLFGASLRRSVDGGATWPDLIPGITNPDTLSEADRAVLDDITILNSDGTPFTTGTQFRAIEFRGAGLGVLVGDGVIARRYIPLPTVRPADTTVTIYPNLVPNTGWSDACSNQNASIYHIIAGVRNVVVAAGISTFPFHVRLETLGGDGNPIPGAAGTYPINDYPAGWAIVMIDVTRPIDLAAGAPPLSAEELYRRFNPNCVSSPRIRMTVDVNNVVREAEDAGGAWENDNVFEGTIACGPAVECSIPQPSPPPRAEEEEGQQPSQQFRLGDKLKKKKVLEKKKIEKKKKSKWGK